MFVSAAEQRAAESGELAASLMKAAVNPDTCPADLVDRVTDMAVLHAKAAWRNAGRVMARLDDAAVACPGCSGKGRLTDDPQILRCERCGGIYTDHRFPVVPEAAIKVVAWHLPQLANAGVDGAFYFDLDIMRPSDGGRQRLHGWADRKTKRVVQWG